MDRIKLGVSPKKCPAGKVREDTSSSTTSSIPVSRDTFIVPKDGRMPVAPKTGSLKGYYAYRAKLAFSGCNKSLGCKFLAMARRAV